MYDLFHKDITLRPRSINLQNTQATQKDGAKNCFVEVYSAGDHVACLSHTGVLVFMNNSPIVWYSKQHNITNSATFGYEFLAMKVSINLLKSLIYKLCIMDTNIKGTSNMFCDNKSVMRNMVVPEFVLKKKPVNILYHMVNVVCVAHMMHVTK